MYMSRPLNFVINVRVALTIPSPILVTLHVVDQNTLNPNYNYQNPPIFSSPFPISTARPHAPFPSPRTNCAPKSYFP